MADILYWVTWFVLMICICTICVAPSIKDGRKATALSVPAFLLMLVCLRALMSYV